MGRLEELYGKIVYLDTAPIIYAIEDGYPDYKEITLPFFKMVSRGKCLAITSVISLLEELVLPVRNKDIWLVRKFQRFFYQTRVRTVEISSQIAEDAAELRALHTKLQIADAIQIATALSTNAAYFLTNDRELPVVSGTKVLITDNLKTKLESNKPETDS